jgi:hypothetical protein
MSNYIKPLNIKFLTVSSIQKEKVALERENAGIGKKVERLEGLKRDQGQLFQQLALLESLQNTESAKSFKTADNPARGPKQENSRSASQHHLQFTAVCTTTSSTTQVRTDTVRIMTQAPRPEAPSRADDKHVDRDKWGKVVCMAFKQGTTPLHCWRDRFVTLLSALRALRCRRPLPTEPHYCPVPVLPPPQLLRQVQRTALQVPAREIPGIMLATGRR